MERLADRVRWEPTGSGIRVVIPAQKDWRIGFFAFWVIGWTLGGVAVFHQTLDKFSSGSISWFNCAWLVGWAFGECWVVSWIVWSLGGNITMSLDPATLTIEYRLFGFLLRRHATQTSEVRNLRFMPRTGSGRAYVASNISFESGYKTWSFGSGLSDAEALAIIDKVLEIYRFPRERALEYLDVSR